MNCVMRCNYGFDIHPPLEPTPENIKEYANFLTDLEMFLWNEVDTDGEGDVVKILDLCDKSYLRISIANGHHIPGNPARCQYFLRFSSWVEYKYPVGMNETRVDDICRFAEMHFGDRVYKWKESPRRREYGIYTWQQVDDAAHEYRSLERADRQVAEEQEADARDTSSQMADTEETPSKKVFVWETGSPAVELYDTSSQMADDEETPPRKQMADAEDTQPETQIADNKKTSPKKALGSVRGKKIQVESQLEYKDGKAQVGAGAILQVANT